MQKTLEYTVCRNHRGMPLITLDSQLGNGQEIKPETLPALAYAELAATCWVDYRLASVYLHGLLEHSLFDVGGSSLPLAG
ncbi:hypothetical protein PQR02_00025 [Paraburkholderia sediminicola]|uniref:Uncharacterized protein n=1 Tax=Paraburkholderia rhynchosiae TaxID=487049 RepID=A0ACC7NPJ4_9BURK